MKLVFLHSLGVIGLTAAHSSTGHANMRFKNLQFPEARKEMCKKFITMPCELTQSRSAKTKTTFEEMENPRFRRNVNDFADGDRCQWSPMTSRRSRRANDYDESSGETEYINTEMTTTGAVINTEPVTTSAVYEANTTPERGTEVPQPEPESKTERPPQEVAPCAEDGANRQPGILILLDETGSMQELGGRDPKTGWGRGRGIIIKKFNQFLDILKQQVQNGDTPDSQFTLVTFNQVASVVEHASILDMPHITEAEYNPGYGTNLYDSIGCALSEYYHIHQGPAAKVFIISDGIHQPGNKKVEWYDNDIHQMISKLRDEQDWEFSFFGAMNDEDKAHLKHEAMNLGIRWSETKKFDFSTKSIDVILKAISSSLKEGSENFALKSELDAVISKKCKKGRRGKLCRRKKALARNKLQNNEFRLDISDDSDQLDF